LETLQRNKSEPRNFIRAHKDAKAAFKKMDMSFASDCPPVGAIKNISGSVLLSGSDKYYCIGDLLRRKLSLPGLEKTDKDLIDIGPDRYWT
jgi:hypothetical protein